MSRPASNVRHVVMVAARAVFLSMCGFFAWRVFDGREAELAEALEGMSYRVGVSVVLVIAGLLVTSWLWARILTAYGYALPWPRAAAVFFSGQIAKYLPGSVWAIGVQARLARSMGVPASRVAGTGLVFLAVHVASGVCFGGVALAVTDASPVPRGVSLALAAAGLLAFHPFVLRALGRLLSGGRGQLVVTWAQAGSYALAMAVVWGAYSAAVVVLLSEPSWSRIWLLLAAVTLSYAAGVLVVIAPAGLGAREAVFVALMSPSLGLTQATALTLVARLVHTGADFVLAFVGAVTLRRTAEAEVSGEPVEGS